MKIGILQKLRSYLFLKILLVFTLALLAIIVLILTTNRFFFRNKIFSTIQRNAVNHVQYIVNDLGIPPDIHKAQRLAEAEKIQIRFQGPALKWASHEDMIDFPGLQLPAYSKESGIFAGFSEAGLTVDIHKDNRRYLFILHRRGEGFRDAAEMFAINVLILTTLSIIGIYLIMNWQLKPIKVLREGVKQLSEGNIDYQMSCRRIDELGKLVDSFNTMAQKIREMFHARDRLLQDVNHELRSPLTRVKVALEFLEDNNTKKSISDDIAEMETMVRELLETDRLKSQYGGLELEETNIMNLVREVCTEFHDKKPGIKLVSFPGDISLNVDQKRIKILFRNILDNALRYSDPNGYPVEISLREKVDEIIIAVQDFGSGIPEQELPYIFEPFYRVDKSRSKKTGGYGLGMSLSKRIMETHGGSIEITSRLNVGTTVFLKFKK
jgi:signal transduction histidine kinase